MISRLLLVGLVGVLGISLPDGADLSRASTCPRTTATSCAPRRETVAFEPIAVEDAAIDGIADELNRQSEGVDLPMVSTPRVATRVRPAAVEPVDVVGEMFAANRVWGESAAATVATSLPAPETRSSFEPIAAAEGPPGMADELNRASEGIDLDPSAVMAGPPRRPSFEPIAVAEDSHDIADELNRAADGQMIARETGPKFGTALRLTHDAAMAWLNVLTKTISAESALH